jgi:6-pyruvoyltetrahydropterin/6-carboxytetrahydropterin synthase
MRISKTIETDTGHRVPGHVGQCRNLHGHRYVITATVEGEVVTAAGSAEEGMVTDFGFLKNQLMKYVHAVMDHHFLCYVEDPYLQVLVQLDHTGVVRFPYIPTAENIALWIHDTLRKHLPRGVVLYEVEVRETPSSRAILQTPEGVW